MKSNQLRVGFELGSPISYLTTITIRLRACPFIINLFFANFCIKTLNQTQKS